MLYGDGQRSGRGRARMPLGMYLHIAMSIAMHTSKSSLPVSLADAKAWACGHWGIGAGLPPGFKLETTGSKLEYAWGLDEVSVISKDSCTTCWIVDGEKACCVTRWMRMSERVLGRHVEFLHSKKAAQTRSGGLGSSMTTKSSSIVRLLVYYEACTRRL